MVTLCNNIPFPPTQTLLRPSLHSPSSFFRPLTPFSLPNPKLKSPRNHLNPILRLRCSVAEESTASPPKTTAQSDSSSRDPSSVDCVVVGGGISGLCIAQALSTKHPNIASNVIVTEARDRVGGNIITVERDGYLWEEGPNSFQPSDPMLTMVVDSGLKDELVLGDPDAPRFVLWNGKLRPVPAKPTDLPFFDLMSIGGKLRAGFGALGIRPPPPGREESVEEFVRRNLGDEVFERLIEPFCSGVYAGDPSKLSMKAAFGKVWKLEQNGGSIIGGAFKAIQERNKASKPPRDPRLPKPKGQTVGSFRKGLTMLPDAISARLGNKVKLSWKLLSISKLDSGEYSLTYETPEGVVSLQSKTVIMTIPSHVASALLRPLSPVLQELGKQNPGLLRLIDEHHVEFLQLINEPIDGSEGDGFDQPEQDMPASCYQCNHQYYLNTLESMLSQLSVSASFPAHVSGVQGPIPEAALTSAFGAASVGGFAAFPPSGASVPNPGLATATPLNNVAGVSNWGKDT